MYGAVLAAQKAVFGKLRPGVEWADMHRAAERALLGALVEAKLLVGDVDAMMVTYPVLRRMPFARGGRR